MLKFEFLNYLFNKKVFSFLKIFYKVISFSIHKDFFNFNFVLNLVL